MRLVQSTSHGVSDVADSGSARAGKGGRTAKAYAERPRPGFLRRVATGTAALLLAVVSFAGCDVMEVPVGNTNTNQNVNANVNDNSNGNVIPAPDPEPEPDKTPPSKIPSTKNSITKTAAGKRSDPEGVAPDANVTVVTWKDARGNDRSMTLGGHLYQYDFSFTDNQQLVSRTANDDAYGHEGFGYVVSHNTQTANSPLGKATAPTKVDTAVFAGAHHAIHRIETVYDRDAEGGGMGIKIPIVIEWFVATGRDHPVWSVTWKTDEIVNPNNVDLNAYRMDVRGPYGSLNFDGAATRNMGDAIGGVSWGDAGFAFKTTDAQLTLNSPWIYNIPNAVAFTRAWTANVNAEMGIVQTRPMDREMGYGDRVVGRERGTTSANAFANKGDCNGFSDARNYSVPCVSGWPYQIMNYDWDAGAGKPVNEATGTKLIAWGTPYGWLASSSFDLFDYSGKADGRGDRSYATFIVLGPKERYNAAAMAWNEPGDVSVMTQTVESLSAAVIGNVTKGAVSATAPRGPGASDMKTLINGYNDSYAAYFLEADANAAAFTFAPAVGQSVDRPIFVVRGYTAEGLPKVSLNGAEVVVNSGSATSGAFVSVNESTKELWVTVNATINAATTIAIAP